MGYIAEFFSEKLKLPVEVFNGMRGVQPDRGVNVEEAQLDAPLIGELVGLALRNIGSCPCEIELVPDAVAAARDSARRAPALVLAGLCIVAALAAALFWFNQADGALQNRMTALQTEGAKLTGISNQIRGLEARQEELRLRSLQLENAVTERSWWVRLLNEINQQFDNDLLWLTTIEPLQDGESMMASLWGNDNSSPRRKSAASSGGRAPAQPVFELRMQGLYRSNSEGEQKVVYDFASKLAKLQSFDAPEFETNRDKYVKVDSGVEGDRYAYHFEIKMPLRTPIKFK